MSDRKIGAAQPICGECDQPMLRKGQRRRDPNDYRHARGCPKASKREAAATERLWAEFESERYEGAR